jgi:benzylsuccinate CoA-transferase BbsE subunit
MLPRTARLAHSRRIMSDVSQDSASTSTCRRSSRSRSRRNPASWRPLDADQYRRAAGGVKSGPMTAQLLWPAKDGWISCTFLFGTALGVFTVKLMRYLAEQGWCDEETGHKDWIGFGAALASGAEPMSEYHRACGILSEFTSSHTKAELLRFAIEKGFLFAPVSTIEEVVESPQLRARDYFQEVEHPELGRSFRYPGPFVKFSESPIQYRRRPPLIGEHNREVYGDELGMSERELKELQQRGII